MKKLTLLFVSLFLITACGGEPGFTLVEDGDRAQGDINDVYSGSAVVSGHYTYAPEATLFNFTFFLDDDSKDLVPNDNLSNGNFFFLNEDSNAMLGLEDEDLEACASYTGEATVLIEGYNSNLVEGAAMDSTVLLEVIENSGPVCE